MNALARVSLTLLLLLKVAPSAWHAATATAAPSTDTPALPAAVQAAGATPTWWATVQADMARAVPGVDPDGLSPTPNWTRFGDQDSARLGRASSGAGDVNGDGFDDLLVGAEWYDNGEVDEGRVYLFYGSPTGLAAQPAWTAEGNNAGANFGSSATTAGDVNGDGFADVIIGAPLYSNGQSQEGQAYLYLGSASGLGAVPNWTWEGDQDNAFFGAVNTAGDVNGDGYSDILVAATAYDSGQDDEGKAFVFYGSPTGPRSTPDWMAESNQVGARFGTGGTAGDVNGDGYGDLIIGALRYDNGQTDEGRAFLYLGSASGLATTAAWTAEPDQVGAEFGTSVSTAGDVNGDGYADVVAGARYYDHGETDEGAAFVYLGSATGLASNHAWTAEGDQPSATFGMFSTTAGDVNGDGYADLLINAPNYDAGEIDEGRAYVYYGSTSGPQTTPAWMAEGNQDSALFGYSFPGHAGDVNGDGYADIAIGALWYDNTQTDEGAAFVYHGGPDGPRTTADWVGESNQAGARFGYTVSTAGDVNGDGFADVVVGAPDHDSELLDEGAAFVFLGSSTGLSTSYHWIAVGGEAGARFGCSVATAGDVNGDGYDDVVVGSYYAGGGGRAYVYHGSTNGLSPSPAWVQGSPQALAVFGSAVSTAGDVNGDGFADLLVGAYLYDNGEMDEGAAFLYLGSIAGLGAQAAWSTEGNQANARLGGYGQGVAMAGDVNGDGYGDVIVGAFGYTGTIERQGQARLFYGGPAGLSTTPDWTVLGESWAAYLGFAVGPAGDVNGDGYSDVVVGSHGYDGGQGWAQGAVYVYLGSATGLQPTADWTAVGDQSDSYFGVSVTAAGDVNGDGYAEMIIGAHNYSNGQYREGRAFLYLGSPQGLRSSPTWVAESDQTEANYGYPVGSAGDVNGDGYADLVVGALRFDSGQSDEGAAFVYYGNHGGLSPRPQQLHSDQRTPIAHLGQSDRPDRFRLALLGRTPFGRGKVKLEWEVKPRGVLFDGTGVQRSAAWLDTGTAGAQLDELISGLSTNTLYHWRVRLRYQPATTPFQSYTRWLTNPRNGWNEARLRTAREVIPVPWTMYLPVIRR